MYYYQYTMYLVSFLHLATYYFCQIVVIADKPNEITTHVKRMHMFLFENKNRQQHLGTILYIFHNDYDAQTFFFEAAGAAV